MSRTWMMGLALCALLGGCGTPLVDGRYDGVAITSIRVMVPPPEGYDLTGMRIGLFFAPGRLEALDDAGALVELADSSRPVERRGTLDLGIFDQPGPELAIPDAAGAPLYAAARLLVYADANGNRRRDPDEPFTAAENRKVWIFAPAALPAELSPTRRPVPAGVHDMIVPLACGSTPPAQYGEVDCGVPLGSGCPNSAACGAGVCVEAMGEVFPGGLCTLVDGPGVCRPRGGILRSQPRNTGVIWLKACVTDADCGRIHPWRCDLGIGGCYPSGDTRLEFFDPPRLMRACR